MSIALPVRMTITGVTLAALTSACGGEDVVLDSSNRGSGSHTDEVTVENAYIVPAFLPGRCAIQVEAGAAMRFTVTNNDPVETARLVGVTTAAAETARIVAPVEIPPQSTVAYGEPNPEIADSGGRVAPVRLEDLAPGLVPATTTDVTFRFERAGDITMPVPVEACPSQVP
ncbi:hypothetical protein ACN27E_02050 [Mycobacterium sp. WMMD1722]|uniref:hypothetical protein n=1 Tax=Mycobacterium sp. WMMD1722 TaxID=3404117 RepID=UPI003BF48908